MGKFERLSVFIECSTGRTPTVESLKDYVDMLAKMGYNELYLGCTDAYKIPDEPYFNYKRGGYTTADFNEIDEYASARGVEVIASIQTLAHLHYLKRFFGYRELRDTDDILLVGDDRVYEFIDRMFAAISAGLKSRRIHIGFDEAALLGTGKYFKKHGYRPKKLILAEHLDKVAKIAAKYGYVCEIWADMLMERDGQAIPEEVYRLIPKNVEAILWNYTERNEDVLKKMFSELAHFSGNIGYAGSARCEANLAPSNRFSQETMTAQMRACHEAGIKHYIVTIWSDHGAWTDVPAVLPALYAAACCASGETDCESEEAKKRFFDITGSSYDVLKSLDRLNDPFGKGQDRGNNRVFWELFADPLLCNYDRVLEKGTGEAYARLADFYAGADGGKYDELVKAAGILASALAIKAELGRDIRDAYYARDKQKLSVLAGKIEPLIGYLSEYLDAFLSYRRRHNMPYGEEVNELWLGGAMTRLACIEKRLLSYINDDERIAELEEAELAPNIAPPGTEDTLNEWNAYNLMTTSMAR